MRAGNGRVVLLVFLTAVYFSGLSALATEREAPWDCVVATVTRVDGSSGTRARPPVVEINIDEVLSKGAYPRVVHAVWEPGPILCTTDYCARPESPVEAPRQGSRWVAWIQDAGKGGSKKTVNLRSFFARPFSDQARKIMAQQCLQQGKASQRVLQELKNP